MVVRFPNLASCLSVGLTPPPPSIDRSTGDKSNEPSSKKIGSQDAEKLHFENEPLKVVL